MLKDKHWVKIDRFAKQYLPVPLVVLNTIILTTILILSILKGEAIDISLFYYATLSAICSFGSMAFVSLFDFFRTKANIVGIRKRERDLGLIAISAVLFCWSSISFAFLIGSFLKIEFIPIAGQLIITSIANFLLWLIVVSSYFSAHIPKALHFISKRTKIFIIWTFLGIFFLNIILTLYYHTTKSPISNDLIWIMVLINKNIFSTLLLCAVFSGFSNIFKKQEVNGLYWMSIAGICLTIISFSSEVQFMSHQFMSHQFKINPIPHYHTAPITAIFDNTVPISAIFDITVKALFIAGFFVVEFTRALNSNNKLLEKNIQLLNKDKLQLNKLVKYLKQEQTEKRELHREMNHAIRGGIRNLRIDIDNMYVERITDGLVVKEILSRVYHIQKLHNVLHSDVIFSDKEIFTSTSKYINSLVNELEQIFSNQRIKIYIERNETISEGLNSSTKFLRDIGSLIVEPTLNAYRAMCSDPSLKEGSINIIVKEELGHIIIQITDDGPGFDYKNHKDGYGLQNIKDITNGLKGTFSFKINKPVGTIFQCEIPTNKFALIKRT